MSIHPTNAVTWFSIPAADFNKSIEFYQSLLDIELQIVDLPGDSSAYAKFPTQTETGVAGAVTSDPRYKKGGNGTGVVIYLACSDIDGALSRVKGLGGDILSPKMPLPGDMGDVAVISDCEGNPLGLHQA